MAQCYPPHQLVEYTAADSDAQEQAIHQRCRDGLLSLLRLVTAIHSSLAAVPVEASVMAAAGRFCTVPQAQAVRVGHCPAGPVTASFKFVLRVLRSCARAESGSSVPPGPGVQVPYHHARVRDNCQ